MSSLFCEAFNEPSLVLAVSGGHFVELHTAFQLLHCFQNLRLFLTQDVLEGKNWNVKYWHLTTVSPNSTLLGPNRTRNVWKGHLLIFDSVG